MGELWGVDLGGTKIEGVVMPENGGPPLCRLRVDTQQEGGYRHILGRICDLVSQMQATSGCAKPRRIGLAMPGAVEPQTGRIKNANTTCLIGQPLLDDLSAALRCTVTGENDANCFALAEATLGAAKGEGVVFGVILGTGVGGGIAIEGKALRGHHAIAGEWGHNLLVRDGEPCYCGRRGCVETVISGPALERYYTSLTGNKKSLRAIAASDEPAATSTIDRLCEYFGQALAPVINILDPDAVVIGGGVGNIDALVTRGRESLERWIFNPSFTAKLLKPSLGDSAGVFGAAMLTR